MPTTEELLAELSKRGATMEQVALLKDPLINTPDAALSGLRAGNARFFSGQPGRVIVAQGDARTSEWLRCPSRARAIMALASNPTRWR